MANYYGTDSNNFQFTGFDNYYGGDGSDFMGGNMESAANLYGGDGNDVLMGEWFSTSTGDGTYGNAIVFADAGLTSGSNVLEGGAGQDALFGWGGADFLYGGNSDDGFMIFVALGNRYSLVVRAMIISKGAKAPMISMAAPMMTAYSAVMASTISLVEPVRFMRKAVRVPMLLTTTQGH
jgi:RTX calcium-binding nonapeptide repeat (4 copies)